MATSRFPTVQYASDHFIDSAGAVLFHLSTQRICLLYLKERNEWILPKVRRNCGESRCFAALRELFEETGLPCRLLDIRLSTRAPPVEEDPAGTPDETRMYEGSLEPFMLTLRKTNEEDMKLIWWYIAAVEEHLAVATPELEFHVEMCAFEEALLKLTYQEDRDVVSRAIVILKPCTTEA